VFGSLTCACGDHLRRAQHEIHAESGGVIVYCDLDGAGGACPAAGDERRPSLGFTAEVAAVLRDLRLRQVRLSSNVLIDAGDLAELGIDASPVGGDAATATRAVA
jgi:GTP cyclohydrolase II